jgi:anti-anti-sigma factor
MTLQIHSVEDDIWLIVPHGRLDLPAARAMEDALIDLCDAGRARVVVDLSDVVYVASAGLKALLVGLRRARMLEGDVRLAGMNDHVREVFDMAGFDQLFSIHASADEAAASYTTA